MTDTLTAERADLLQALRGQRFFLRYTAQNLTDEQASQRTTVSQLTVGGVIKHVCAMEEQWARFIVEGPQVIRGMDEAAIQWHADTFRLLDGETLEGVLAEYEQVAAKTDELVQTLPDLDASHPLPEAPWFEPGARWTARRTFLHIIAETAQHSGHADIIREALDGQKTMG